MRYLLDTNTCIAIIKQRPSKALLRLQNCQGGDVGVSSIVVAELSYGATKSQASIKAHEALDQFLLPLEIVSFDEKATRVYGSIRLELEKKGTPIGPLDTLIAASAIAFGATLVTNNTKEFSRVRHLKLEDWT